MENFTTIQLEISNQVASIWLNRPEIHNAFNEEMIGEILRCYEMLNMLDSVRVVVLRGKGKSFCAGADLNWMRDVAKFTYEENYAESYQLSLCFNAIYTCKKPCIAVVHGAAIGGANGLLAACDFVYCTNDTVFSLSEVKIGIVPACISPYIIKRVGEYPAKELMLTGKRFKGEEAERIGLVNKSLNDSEIDAKLNETIHLLMTSAPKAITHCKNLIYNVVNRLSHKEALEYTAKMIAEIRASDEGQEGTAAFLEKRKPNWVK